MLEHIASCFLFSRAHEYFIHSISLQYIPENFRDSFAYSKDRKLFTTKMFGKHWSKLRNRRLQKDEEVEVAVCGWSWRENRRTSTTKTNFWTRNKMEQGSRGNDVEKYRCLLKQMRNINTPVTCYLIFMTEGTSHNEKPSHMFYERNICLMIQTPRKVWIRKTN